MQSGRYQSLWGTCRLHLQGRRRNFITSSTLKEEAASSLETVVRISQTTGCHILVSNFNISIMRISYFVQDKKMVQTFDILCHVLCYSGNKLNCHSADHCWLPLGNAHYKGGNYLGLQHVYYFLEDTVCAALFKVTVPKNYSNVIRIVTANRKTILFFLGPIWRVPGARMLIFTKHWPRTNKLQNMNKIHLTVQALIRGTYIHTDMDICYSSNHSFIPRGS